MIVGVSGTTNEVALSGSSVEDRALAEALRRGHCDFTLDAKADLSPYASALASLVVRTTQTEGVRIAIDQDKLEVAGPLYFDDHAYLDPSSLPLVINDARSEGETSRGVRPAYGATPRRRSAGREL